MRPLVLLIRRSFMVDSSKSMRLTPNVGSDVPYKTDGEEKHINHDLNRPRHHVPKLSRVDGGNWTR